jgi:hypothetical protein
VGLLTVTGGLVCQTQFAVTTALAIYGFDAAGALGTGLAGARLLPVAAAGVLAGGVAARGSPGFRLLGVVVVGHRSRVGAGEDVVREGEPADRFYVLLEGLAAVYSRGRLVRTLAPGDHFGEIALLHDTLRTATVRGLTDVRLFSLDSKALHRAGPSVLTAAQLV